MPSTYMTPPVRFVWKPHVTERTRKWFLTCVRSLVYLQHCLDVESSVAKSTIMLEHLAMFLLNVLVTFFSSFAQRFTNRTFPTIFNFDSFRWVYFLLCRLLLRRLRSLGFSGLRWRGGSATFTKSPGCYHWYHWYHWYTVHCTMGCHGCREFRNSRRIRRVTIFLNRWEFWFRRIVL